MIMGSHGHGGVVLATKVDPKFLHSNSTSHVWAFGAIAELIDNAYDPDVSASTLIIDKQEIGGKTCIVFQDNGNGMDKEHLYNMLSFGFCEKDRFTQREHLAIGHYGNGFKSGSMRLGKDALVLTRHKETAGVGFLSQTYLTETKAETVFVPILQYKLPDLTREDDLESRSSLKAILNYSVFTEEKELIEELKELGKEKDKTGTKIIIFNLHKLKDDSLELDFDSDLKDIKCRQVYLKDEDIKEDKEFTKSSKYKRSLREYCRILYLQPKMKITLRGTAVRAKLISKSLSLTEKDCYRPLWLKNTARIIIGFKCEDYDSEDYGLMLYHRNRLIKAYEKVGYQKQPNGMGVGVIMVSELNFLQPTHNKQDFNSDEKYNSVIKAFGTKLNDYWNAKGKDIQNIKSDLTKLEPDALWVQCDECNKWRRLPPGTKEKNLPEKWFCHMNKDNKHNQCEHEQEKEDKDEIVKGSSYKKIKPQKQPSTLRIEKQSTSGTDSPLKVKLAVSEKSAVSRKRSLFQADPNSTIDTSLEDGQSMVKVSKPKEKILNPVVSTIDDTSPSVASPIPASNSGSSSLDKAQCMAKKNFNGNIEKSETVSPPVKLRGKSLNPSLATHSPKAATSMKDFFSPAATIGYRMARASLHNQKNENLDIVDVEKQALQGEMKGEDFYKEKIEELKTKLNLRIRMLDETEEKLRTFQYNVHRLLSLIVPGRIVGDVSQIERNVEEMIKMNETESRRDFEVKDPKKKPSTSFLASSSSDDVPVKDNQCCLS